MAVRKGQFQMQFIKCSPSRKSVGKVLIPIVANPVDTDRKQGMHSAHNQVVFLDVYES